MPRVTRSTIVLTATAILAVAGAGGYYFWPTAASSSPAVAKVDGTAISVRDLDIRLAQVLPMASFHGNIESSRLLGLRRAALDELILDELIYREARRTGGSADSSSVDAELAQIRQRFENEEEFQNALAQNGMRKSAFRQYLGKIVLVRQARQARSSQGVSDADVDAYYRTNAHLFLRPEQVRLMELLVRVDPANPESAGPAEKKARGLAARIRAGEPFGPLARENSEDDYRVKDGDLGLVHRGRLDADLEAAVFAAGVGEVRLTRSLHGFHVFKVLDRQPPTQLTFEEAKPAIRERLMRERRELAERTWFASLRSAAKIEILDPALRDATPAPLPEVRAKGLRGQRPDGRGQAR
jgi:parvulin-like peptidyl-prolyl isomerase